MTRWEIQSKRIWNEALDFAMKEWQKRREAQLSSSPAEARGKVGGEGDRPSEGLLERQEGKEMAGQPEDGEMASSHARIGKNEKTN